MVYALMFDNYQGKVQADQWCVSRSGTLDFCRQYDTLSDNYVAWAKSDFSDRVWKEDHPVGGEAGAIYELTAVANFSASFDEVAERHLEPPARSRPVPIGWVMGGFLAGMVAGLLLQGRISNPFAGDDK